MYSKLGSTNAATNAINSVVLGKNCSSTANAHCIGTSLTNGTAGSLLIDSSANIRANNTTCDFGTHCRWID